MCGMSLTKQKSGVWIASHSLPPIEGGSPLLGPNGAPLGSANPQANGSASPGTSGFASHQDHVHPASGGGFTPVTTFLGSDVVGSSVAGTFTDALTSNLGGSPSGHTFLLSSSIVCSGGSTLLVNCELYDGTNVLAVVVLNIPGSTFPGGAACPPIYYSAVSNITIHWRFTCTTANAPTAKASTNFGGNFATWLTYQQLT